MMTQATRNDAKNAEFVTDVGKRASRHSRCRAAGQETAILQTML